MLSKRITLAVPNVDLLNGNECTARLRQCYKKTRQPKHGGYKSILEIWHAYNTYRKSLSLTGWTEEQIIEYDKIALEDHSYVATKPERVQNAKHWVLRLNQDGAQQPPNPRPDFAQAKRECKRMHDEHVKRSQQEYRPILRDQQSRQRRGQAFEGIDEHDYRVDPRTGWRFNSSESQGPCRIRPRQNIGTATTGWHSLGQVSVAGRYTSRQSTEGVNRTPAHTVRPLFITRTRLAQDCKPWRA